MSTSTPTSAERQEADRFAAYDRSLIIPHLSGLPPLHYGIVFTRFDKYAEESDQDDEQVNTG